MLYKAKDSFYKDKNKVEALKREISRNETNLIVSEGELKRLKSEYDRLHAIYLQAKMKLSGKENFSFAARMSISQNLALKEEAAIRGIEVQIQKEKQSIDDERNKIKKHEIKIVELQSEIKRMKNQITSDKNQESKDRVNFSLQKQVEEYDQRLKQLEVSHNTFQRKVDLLRGKVKDLKDELSRLQK